MMMMMTSRVENGTMRTSTRGLYTRGGVAERMGHEHFHGRGIYLVMGAELEWEARSPATFVLVAYSHNRHN